MKTLSYKEQEVLVEQWLRENPKLTYQQCDARFQAMSPSGSRLTMSNYSRAAAKMGLGHRNLLPFGNEKRMYVAALYTLYPDLTPGQVRELTKRRFGECLRPDICQEIADYLRDFPSARLPEKQAQELIASAEARDPFPRFF